MISEAGGSIEFSFETWRSVNWIQKSFASELREELSMSASACPQQLRVQRCATFLENGRLASTDPTPLLQASRDACGREGPVRPGNGPQIQ